jgi:hypothetical protein
MGKSSGIEEKLFYKINIGNRKYFTIYLITSQKNTVKFGFYRKWNGK